MTDPKPMSEVEFAYITGHFASDFRTAQNDKMAWCYGRELVAEVRRLRARERELHNRIRLEFVQHGSKVDWWVCQECGETGPSPERHAFVNGKPCLAAPLPKEDEG